MEAYKNVLVFGDVHGEAGKLGALIAEAHALAPDVQIMSVGDLVDRGPDSRGVLDLCVENRILGVMGNHEVWLREFCTQGTLSGEVYEPIMGCLATLASYGVSTEVVRDKRARLEGKSNLSHLESMAWGLAEKLPAEHREYILNLPLTRTFRVGEQTYRIIHASLKNNNAIATFADSGVPDDVLLKVVEEEASDSLLWVGPVGLAGIGEANVYRFRDGSIQIFGHVPLREVVIGPHWIALDTGCGRKRDHSPLSGVLLSEDPSLNMKVLVQP